jgi:[ribosomal protein S18]-alanine N-acetyltransferase
MLECAQTKSGKQFPIRRVRDSGRDTDGARTRRRHADGRSWPGQIWLGSTRDFKLHRLLYAYDKVDFSIPSPGNQQIRVRPARLSDIPALLTVEQACFEDFWRYDAYSFEDIMATHPYFVVAEWQGQVIGYQFNALDGEYGYLVRIAVHPSASGKAIGARLMAEAIAFFKRSHVLRIMLNTQEDNTHAHRLYEWFGFIRVPQIGFVLRKSL